MVHHVPLLLTLAAAFVAALGFGLITQRLRLSPLVGYLLAGVAIGPFTPGYVADQHLAEQLAEVGVVLLMFGVGLHFHLKDLLAVRGIAIPGAVAQCTVAVVVAALVTQPFGWSWTAGIVLGLAVSVASTVVLLRVLADNDALHTPAGHAAVGWLIVEDVFTVIVLVLMPVLVGPSAQAGAANIAMSLGLAVLKLGALVAVALIVGQKLIPKLLEVVARTRSRELFTLSVLVVALGLAVGSAYLFGASMALGAFLAGTIVGQSEFSSRAASDALPVRDSFTVLFFVAMGMLFDPRSVVQHAGLVAATLGVIVLAKPLAAFVVVLVLRRPARTAVTVALALAQIGEFSFILAALGRKLEVLPPEATQAIVAAAVISVTLNPLAYRLVPLLTRLLAGVGAARQDGASSPPEDDTHRAVVIGYGPVGQSLCAILKEQHIEPTVVELNLDTVKRLSSEGTRAVYGDAAQLQILEDAGVATAKSLVFAASGSAPEPVIRAARELNPTIVVIARATYAAEAPQLRRAGADAVVAAESEVALAMGVEILSVLGATPAQIDRARARVRESVDGKGADLSEPQATPVKG